jgi:hypothetical protein
MERPRGASFLLCSLLLASAMVCAQSAPPAPSQGTQQSVSPATFPVTPTAANPGTTANNGPDYQPIAPPIDPHAPRMSKQTHYEIIRDFETQIVYTRTAFPMSAKGLVLKDGVTSPNGKELQQQLALWGPALKPGDPANISYVKIANDHIELELNNGPVRHKKWYQHIEITGAQGQDVTQQQSERVQNPHGSYLQVYFNKHVPEMTAQQLRDLLLPVLDFSARNKEQAYLNTLPPKVKEAIQAHHVLVGMDSEMVLHAMGRPPKKVRERDGETEYEEWIYGEPPKDVDFVRIVNDEVVRVETVKVGGEKIVRTEKEVILKKPDQEVEAKKQPEDRPSNAPSLRRPGEDPQNVPNPANGPSPTAPVPPLTPPQMGDPGPGATWAGPR